MGQVVPFIARVRDSGDWTPSERARLEDLADHLGQSGLDVEVIFGATDEGDPWCVVTDANGDVLIHVARIGGTFVVHSAVDDSLSEGVDLHTALRERLAATEDAIGPKSATVLPFDVSARQAQTLLALVVATAFFYETAGGKAEAAELPHGPSAPHDEPPPPVPARPADDATAQDRETTARAAAVQDDGDKPQAAVVTHDEPAPAPVAHTVEDAAALPAAIPAAPPEPAPTTVLPPAAPDDPAPAPPVVIQGTAGDDSLLGTAANERILGGAGNDTLDGEGGHDTLDGGAGDDKIILCPTGVAIGGEGADTFVIHKPAPGTLPLLPGEHPGEHFFFGTILDFNAGQGDRVVNGQGVTVRLTPHPDAAGDHGDPHGGEPHTFTTMTGFTQPLVRVEVDLDGDGVNDGYILVGEHGEHGIAPAPPGEHAELPPITATGHSLSGGEVFG